MFLLALKVCECYRCQTKISVRNASFKEGALPGAPPLGAKAEISLPPQGRSLLWSAADDLARAPYSRRLIRAKASAFPPETVESISHISNSLGVMARGILVARPNSVLNDRFDTNGYAQFSHRERDRRTVLFSAGSDGLVHAFDAGADDAGDPGTGAEIFAYAPRGVVFVCGPTPSFVCNSISSRQLSTLIRL